MRFSSWYSPGQIELEAPEVPGVFQVRGPGLLAYPRGKSAMVHYAQAVDLRAAMLGWARQHGHADYAYRHTLVLGGYTPEAALERVLGRFVGRFGVAPSPTGE